MKILVLLGVLVAVGLVVLVVACAARPARTERARDRRSAGSPVATERCRPRMPEVDRLAPERLESVFQLAFTKPSSSGLVIVTPGRLLMELPTKPLAPDLADSAKKLASDLFGAARDLHVLVISYTALDALMADESYTECIPFLGMLLAFGSVGHRIVVFEGHPSALPIALRDADVLLVDDGMAPFLQSDWQAVAWKAMKPRARIFVHRRSDYKLTELVEAPSNTAPSASPGEAVPTYVTALLSTLALGKVRSVVLVAGRPLPRLTDLSQDPGLVAWTSALPSDFDLHSADVADYAIGYILGLTRSGSSDDATIETVLRAKLVVNGTLADVAFSLKLTTGAGHEHRLEIGFPAPALE